MVGNIKFDEVNLVREHEGYYMLELQVKWSLRKSVPKTLNVYRDVRDECGNKLDALFFFVFFCFLSIIL